jgi:hypothetical protein
MLRLATFSPFERTDTQMSVESNERRQMQKSNELSRTFGIDQKPRQCGQRLHYQWRGIRLETNDHTTIVRDVRAGARSIVRRPTRRGTRSETARATRSRASRAARCPRATSPVICAASHKAEDTARASRLGSFDRSNPLPN